MGNCHLEAGAGYLREEGKATQGRHFVVFKPFSIAFLAPLHLSRRPSGERASRSIYILNSSSTIIPMIGEKASHRDPLGIRLSRFHPGMHNAGSISVAQEGQDGFQRQTGLEDKWRGEGQGPASTRGD